MQNTNAYKAIAAHYGSRTARRSGVPLINHIDEGLVILDAIGARYSAKLAFCLHPLVQADEDLVTNYNELEAMDPIAVVLAMEYRFRANNWLSDKVYLNKNGNPVYSGLGPSTGPIKEVADMLIADKVQNFKDFLAYHKITHKRSKELNLYFNVWLDALGVSNEQFEQLCSKL